MEETTPLVGHGKRPERLEKQAKPRRGPWQWLRWVLALVAAMAMMAVVVIAPALMAPPAVRLHDIARIANLTDYETLTGGRLIVVGDIHGLIKPLKRLMAKVQFDPKRDKLVLLGDFITKGEDLIAVLDYLIDNRAECVLGNHEYSVLELYTEYWKLPPPHFSGVDDDHAQVEGRKLELKLAKRLRPRHIKFINLCSVIKRLGTLALGYPAIAVHAGVRPDLPLDQQPPNENLEMRALLKPDYKRLTSDTDAKGAVAWLKIYNKQMKLEPKSQRTVVFYGHHAAAGLKLKKYTRGLDTGCAKGGQLTAMVIEHGVEELVQVDC